MRVLCLLLLTSLVAAPQDKPPKATMSGSVVDSTSGLPLAKVSIVAESLDAAVPLAATTTDAKGNFKFIDLEPGQYKLHGERNGYLKGAYGAKRPEAAGTTISLAEAQELKDLAIRLTPFSAIAGTLRDTDGEALAGVAINLFRLSFAKGRRQIQPMGESTATDDLGHYRIARLPPGKYYVRAEAPTSQGLEQPVVDHSAKDAGPPTVLVPAFYPGVAEADSARTVEVGPGARVTGIDVVLPRSRMVRIRGKVIAPSKSQSNVTLIQGRDPNGVMARSISGISQPDGSFEFFAVPPGSYTLLAEASASSDPSPNDRERTLMTMIRTNGARSVTPLEVGATDMENVQVTVISPAVVQGRLQIDDPDKKPEAKSDNPTPSFSLVGGMIVMGEGGAFTGVEFSQGGNNDPVAAVGPEKTFEGPLSQGRYEVNVIDPSFPMRNLVVKSILSGHTDVLREGLTINGPGVVPLEIVVAAIGGLVEGTTVDKDGKPAAGATVAMVPSADLRARRDRYFDTTADQYGHFEFKNVPPGDYEVLAWDDVEPDAWYDPDFLRTVESKADSVTLKPKGHETLQVHLQQ